MSGNSGHLWRTVLAVCVSANIAGCMESGFLKSNGSAAEPEAGETQTVVDQSTGVTSKKLGASSTDTQTITAGEGTDVAGSTVAFPPGTLAVDTVVSLEAGSSIAGAAIAEELGLDLGVSLEPTGTALVVTNDAKVNASQPFTLAIALPGVSFWMLDDSYVVVYRVYDASTGGYLVGIIPTSDLTVADGRVSFTTIYFGSYQIAVPSKPITSAKVVTSTTPFLSKVGEAQLPAPTWTIPVASVSTARQIEASATLSGVAADRCVLTADEDQSQPWDLVSSRLSSPKGSVAATDAAFEGKVRFECIDGSGRTLTSDWSKSVAVEAKEVPPPSPPSPPSPPPNSAPTLSFTTPVSAVAKQIGETATFQWTASDSDDNANITFYVGGSGSGACSATADFHQGPVPEDDAPIDIDVIVPDTAQAGNLYLCAELDDGTNSVVSVWSQPIVVQVCTWKVTAATADWNTPSNWEYCSGVIPGSTDRVVVPTGAANNPIVSSDVTIFGIGRGAGGGRIAVASGVTLTLGDSTVSTVEVLSDVTFEGSSFPCTACVVQVASGYALGIFNGATLQLGKGLTLKTDYILRVGSHWETGRLKSNAVAGPNNAEWPVITTDEANGFSGIIAEGLNGFPSALDLNGIRIENVAPSVPAIRIVDYTQIVNFDSVWLSFIGPDAAKAIQFRASDQTASICVGIDVQDTSWSGLKFDDYLGTNLDAGVCDLGSDNVFTVSAGTAGAGGDQVAERDTWNRVNWGDATTTMTCAWTAAVDEQWSTIGNWSCGRVPTHDDFVRFPSSSPGPARINTLGNYIRGFAAGVGGGLISIEATGSLHLLSETSTVLSDVTVEGVSTCATCFLHTVGSATVRNTATLTLGPYLTVKVGHALGDRFNIGVNGSEAGHLGAYTLGPTFMKGDNFQPGHGWSGIYVGGASGAKSHASINAIRITETKETAPGLTFYANSTIDQLDGVVFDPDGTASDAFSLVVETCDIPDVSWTGFNFVDSIQAPPEPWRGNVDIHTCSSPAISIGATGAGAGATFAKDPNSVLTWP